MSDQRGIPKKRRPIMDRWADMVSPEPMSGCWLWGGATNNKGYGVINEPTATKRGLTRYAHRLSYEFHIGPIGDLEICHRCDTPACVNPAHLFLGTHQENMLDSKRKGRARGWPRGVPTRSPDGRRWTVEEALTNG